MKHVKTVTVPATTRELVEKVTCDLCQKIIKKGYHEIDEVMISHSVGFNSASGGNQTIELVDMCGECFQTKFKDWLKSMGVKTTAQECDW